MEKTCQYHMRTDLSRPGERRGWFEKGIQQQQKTKPMEGTSRYTLGSQAQTTLSLFGRPSTVYPTEHLQNI